MVLKGARFLIQQFLFIKYILPSERGKLTEGSLILNDCKAASKLTTWCILQRK